MNTLANTTYIRFGIMIDTPDDDVLIRITQIINQIIYLISLLIIAWQYVEKIIYFISDILTTINYTYQVSAIIFNSIMYGLR
jgi:hypothetical protein